MGKRRKTFTCGHAGYGSYCHTCDRTATVDRASAIQADIALEEKRRRRAAWRKLFDTDPVDLRGFPKPIVEQARLAIAQVKDGTSWQILGGKKIQASGVISIPVGRSYRLICTYTETKEGRKAVQPVEFLSHQDYNTSRYLG